MLLAVTLLVCLQNVNVEILLLFVADSTEKVLRYDRRPPRNLSPSHYFTKP